jgi:hypothetical protein
VKINALITLAAALVSSIGALLAKLAQHDFLLVIALGVLLAQWHAQRRRQDRQKVQAKELATLHNLSEEAQLLGCSQIAVSHPELQCELRIFERAVLRSLADLYHGRRHATPLPVIERFVTTRAPALLEALRIYDDKLTLQSVCQQFRLMSQRLLPQAPASFPPAETLFATSSHPSPEPANTAPLSRARIGSVAAG